MAWIESHQKLKDDPKTIALAVEMGWNIYECIGRLHSFWWWCVDHCEDGDLRRYNDAVIASAAGVAAPEAKRFVDAMYEGCGNGESFLERQPYFRVRNWWKFNGNFLQVKYKHQPEKWKGIRILYDNRSLNGSENTIPNQPNLTNQKHLVGEFESLWATYPSKDGKKLALRAFLASVKTAEDVSKVKGALANYLKHLAHNPWKHPKNGSTWFGNWQDWVDFKEPERRETDAERDQRILKELEAK